MGDIARRSSQDPKWKKTKDAVDRRDKRQCQFIKCLSAKEGYSLQNGNPKTLDRCHIFSASAHPELIYNVKNVITLQRFIHTRMDSYQNPLNGDSIDLNEHYYWWLRILNKQVIKYDAEKDYELELKNIIS